MPFTGTQSTMGIRTDEVAAGIYRASGFCRKLTTGLADRFEARLQAAMIR
jgi:hypothetical protein